MGTVAQGHIMTGVPEDKQTSAQGENRVQVVGEQSRGPVVGVQAQGPATGVPAWGPTAGVQARGPAVVRARIPTSGRTRGPAAGVLCPS